MALSPISVRPIHTGGVADQGADLAGLHVPRSETRTFADAQVRRELPMTQDPSLQDSKLSGLLQHLQNLPMPRFLRHADRRAVVFGLLIRVCPRIE